MDISGSQIGIKNYKGIHRHSKIVMKNLNSKYQYNQGTHASLFPSTESTHRNNAAVVSNFGGGDSHRRLSTDCYDSLCELNVETTVWCLAS
jgi:hypothetical protein